MRNVGASPSSLWVLLLLPCGVAAGTSSSIADPESAAKASSPTSDQGNTPSDLDLERDGDQEAPADDRSPVEISSYPRLDVWDRTHRDPFGSQPIRLKAVSAAFARASPHQPLLLPPRQEESLILVRSLFRVAAPIQNQGPPLEDPSSDPAE